MAGFDDRSEVSNKEQNERSQLYLPHDILAQIVSRLPASTILHLCHPLSRNNHNEFNSLISDHLFSLLFQSHNNNNNNNTSLLAFNGHLKSCTLIEYNHDDNVQPRKLEHKINMDFRCRVDHENTGIFGDLSVRASCNGCILVSYTTPTSLRLQLVNPITRRSIVLPKSINKTPRNSNFYTLGYSSKSNLFKVVRVIANKTPSRIISAEVCTLDGDGSGINNDGWKIVTQEIPMEFTSVKGDAVLLNDALHWLILRSGSILRFDIHEEKFALINTPVADLSRNVSHLSVLHGLIIYVDYTWINYHKADILVMKEYGVKESWTRFTIMDKIHAMERFKLIRVLENGEVLMLSRSPSDNKFYLDVYDPKHRKRDERRRVDVLEGMDQSMRTSMTVHHFVPNFLALRQI